MLYRYLVRKPDSSVFIWTEALAMRKDLEEVFATDATSALTAPSIPTLNAVSLEQIEDMRKETLLLFAKVRLGKELDVKLKKDDLVDMVKMLVFTQPQLEEQQEVPSTAAMNLPRGKLP